MPSLRALQDAHDAEVRILTNQNEQQAAEIKQQAAEIKRHGSWLAERDSEIERLREVKREVARLREEVDHLRREKLVFLGKLGELGRGNGWHV